MFCHFETQRRKDEITFQIVTKVILLFISNVSEDT